MRTLSPEEVDQRLYLQKLLDALPAPTESELDSVYTGPIAERLDELILYIKWEIEGLDSRGKGEYGFHQTELTAPCRKFINTGDEDE